MDMEYKQGIEKILEGTIIILKKMTEPENVVATHEETKNEETTSYEMLVEFLKGEIMKDRTKNEKIKQALKEFGVTILSDLPSGKYTEFMKAVGAL